MAKNKEAEVKEEATPVAKKAAVSGDTPIVVTVVIGEETKTFEDIKTKATRKARGFIRRHGLTISNADSNETQENGNQTVIFNDPSPKQLEAKAKAEAAAAIKAEEDAAKAAAPAEEPVKEGDW